MRKPNTMLNQTMVDELDRAECLALLGTQRLGRIAVVADVGKGPHVVPVNYTLLRGSIVLRSIPGTKFDKLVTEPVSFEVDSFDPFQRTGWSVVVEGLAYEASNLEMEIEELNLVPLLEQQNSRWVRITPRAISGRRVTAAS